MPLGCRNVELRHMPLSDCSRNYAQGRCSVATNLPLQGGLQLLRPSPLSGKEDWQSLDPRVRQGSHLEQVEAVQELLRQGLHPCDLLYRNLKALVRPGLR